MTLSPLAKARILGSLLVTDRGCWESSYARSGVGYVHFAYWDSNGQMRTTTGHRAVYAAIHGHVPDELAVDHLCRNVWCVRPSHLEAVTVEENNRRADIASGIRSAAAACTNGHPYDDTNTYLRPDGRGRGCRECIRIAARDYQRRRRIAARSTR